MKKLLLSVIACISILSANAQQWVTASTIGGVQSSEVPTYTAKDAQGNLYVASNFSGTRNFGPGTQTATGIYDVYVVKYDAAGNFVWFQKFGSVGAFLQAGGLVADAAGNIYLAGTFTNQLVLNGNLSISAGGRDIFICKLNQSGTTVWGKSLGGAANEEVFGMSQYGGKIYLSGNYNVAFTDGAISIAAPVGAEDIFIASYEKSSGACSGMLRCGGASSDVANSVSAGPNSIYVTGSFIGAANFGTFSLTSANTSGPNPSPTPDMFLIRLDSSLSVTWALKAGAGSTDQGNGVSQDAQGNVYVAGYFLRTVNFGNGVSLVEANGYGDGFLVKYSPSGVCQWGQKISGGLSDVATFVSTDPLGSSYVSGAFGATATITGSSGTGSSLVTSGVNDGFIAKWGSDGILRWVISAGGTGDDRAQSVIYDNNGYCQFVINHSGSITAGSLGNFAAPAGAFGQLIGSFNGLTAGLNALDNSVTVKLYPNPVSDGVITVAAAENTSIRYIAVYSVDGRLVFENNAIGGSELQINTAQFVKGQYIVSIQTNEGTGTAKFTVN